MEGLNSVTNLFLLINLFLLNVTLTTWWLMADGWCWFVLREKYCSVGWWLMAGAGLF
jgi:hypothetical protein